MYEINKGKTLSVEGQRLCKVIWLYHLLLRLLLLFRIFPKLLLLSHCLMSLWSGCNQDPVHSDYWVKSAFFDTDRLVQVYPEIDLLKSCIIVISWLENILLPFIYFLLFVLEVHTWHWSWFWLVFSIWVMATLSADCCKKKWQSYKLWHHDLEFWLQRCLSRSQLSRQNWWNCIDSRACRGTCNLVDIFSPPFC